MIADAETRRSRLLFPQHR